MAQETSESDSAAELWSTATVWDSEMEHHLLTENNHAEMNTEYFRGPVRILSVQVRQIKHQGWMWM